MNNENNDVYHDDTSFNENGVDSLNNESSAQFPNANRGNAITGIGKGFVEGAKAGLNLNRNSPALGVNGAKKDDPMKGQKKTDKNGTAPSNKGNPANGQKDNSNNKNKNPLPGGMNKNKNDNNKNVNNPNNKSNPNNKNKENNKDKNKKNGFGSKGNPLARSGIGSKLGLGKKKDSNKEGVVGPNLNEVAKKGLKTAWTVAPIQVKVAVVALSIVPLIILGLIAFLSLFGGITAATTAAMCENTAYGTSTGTPADVGSFMCSMQKPLKNVVVTSLYGWREYDPSHMHEGIDLGASCGTAVYAVQDGEVIFASYTSGYGNSVQIKHGDTITTWYAHLSSIEVEKGQTVKQGQEIAKSGNTGGNYACHLHFEVRNGTAISDSVSPNPYFGYSDKGYEKCITREGGYRSGCGSVSARKMGDDGETQLCNITNNYFSNDSESSNDCCETDNKGASGNSSDLRKFIGYFEGCGPYCDSSKTQYRAYQNSGDRLTIGYGVTSDYLPNLTHVGQCMDVSVVDAAKDRAIDSKRKNVVQKNFSSVNLAKHQEDAMTSMAYNGCGNFFSNIAKAASEDDLKGVWDAMKGCINKGTQFEAGLKSRRKAEFALYVTGDYSIETIKKYQKSYTDAQYDDYDSEGIIAKKATGTSSSCSNTGSASQSAVVERAIKELEHWNSSNNHCADISKYTNACGQGGCSIPWCAAFVSYILNETGVSEKIGLPKSCVANLMNSAKGAEIHKAGGSYIPKAGDIITFDWNGNRSTHHHVGIVEYVEGKTVHTIEGNSSNSIKRNTYSLDSKFIYDYASY